MSNPTADSSGIEEYVRTHSDSSLPPGYIADHGETMPTETEVVRIEGVQIRLSQDITESDWELVRNAVQSTEVIPKACYATALGMWEYNHRFAYVEGVAVPAGIGADTPLPHAWCMLDGEKLIDFTPQYKHHYGVMFTDDSTVREYGLRGDSYRIINDRSRHYAFLRDRGYLEADND